jgi:hypothetical protein
MLHWTTSSTIECIDPKEGIKIVKTNNPKVRPTIET